MISLLSGLSANQVDSSCSHFNPLADGNRGHRVLAHAIFGSQEMYNTVKATVLMFLKEKHLFYTKIFGSSPSLDQPISGTYESIIIKLSNEASLSSLDNWFQFPEIVQLAADSFQ